jgi:HlyD family secretion protein
MFRVRLPRLRWLLLFAAAAAGATVYVWQQEQAAEPRYVTAPVSTGNIVRAIVTTGAVNPVVTVEVGSYVSGVIQTLYCDYNTQVKAGQPCAKIDPRPFQVVVDQASANLESARAQLNKDRASLAYAKVNYERDRKLLKQGIVSQDTVDSDKSAFDQGTAQVALDESSINQRAAELHAA